MNTLQPHSVARHVTALCPICHDVGRHPSPSGWTICSCEAGETLSDAGLDSAPSEDDVVIWLASEQGISEDEAEAWLEARRGIVQSRAEDDETIARWLASPGALLPTFV